MSLFVSQPQTRTVKTDSHTLVLADAWSLIEMNKATANNLTVPPNSSVPFPVDTCIFWRQLGAGQTTVVAGSGVTINPSSTLKSSGQYTDYCLHQRAIDEWVLIGNLTA